MALFLLNENEMMEMAYPAAFSMDTFKSLKTFNDRIKYCTEKLGRQLGSGSSRRVFPIDDEKVLKLAMNKKGLAQNEAECDWFLQQIGLFAKVYDVDENYKWIEMQRARKAKASDFKRLTGFNFMFICEYINYVHSLYTRNRYARNFRNASYDQMFQEIAERDDYYDSIFGMLYDYMANTQLESIGDLKRLSSWGVVVENGEESLVMIDYGLNDDVAKEYYGFRSIRESDVRKAVKRVIKEYLKESQDYNPLYDVYSEYEVWDILEEFLSDKENGIETKQWDLIPAEQYKNLLNRYMNSPTPEAARIPEGVVDNWMKKIMYNFVAIEHITELAGHSQWFPSDDCENVFGDDIDWTSYEEASDFLENIGFYDWCKLPDGSDAWSDYGLHPIGQILNEYTPKMPPEEVLILINRILDVAHCRGDLASAFIEGGSKTCSGISLQRNKVSYGTL